MEGVYAVRYGNWGFIDAPTITLAFEPSSPTVTSSPFSFQ
jgi:hypothetical protein